MTTSYTMAVDAGTDILTVRVFPGTHSKQRDLDGRLPNPERWYWEPASYRGRAIWTPIGFDSRLACEDAVYSLAFKSPQLLTCG